ncbi:MAG TPA: hypothetical protein VGJ86_13325 [Acidimicrobiales bacterium]|jgi:hypothetical protein
MAKLNITWNKFTVHKKHDIDRDAPYLWVFGIIVDANTLASRNFVVRRPSGVGNLGQKKFQKGESVSVSSTLDIVKDVTPVLGFLVGGVVVVAWENAMTTDRVIADAYDAAAADINKFINARIDAGNLETPSAGDLAELRTQISEDVRDTIREGWTVFQLLPDHEIGEANTVLSFDGAKTQPLNFRFTKRSTDYQLEGEMKFLP